MRKTPIQKCVQISERFAKYGFTHGLTGRIQETEIRSQKNLQMKVRTGDADLYSLHKPVAERKKLLVTFFRNISTPVQDRITRTSPAFLAQKLYPETVVKLCFLENDHSGVAAISGEKGCFPMPFPLRSSLFRIFMSVLQNDDPVFSGNVEEFRCHASGYTSMSSCEYGLLYGLAQKAAV